MFSTLLRGMVGVAAAILIVAVTWTVYIKRDAVIDASKPVARLLSQSTGEGQPAVPAKDQ